MRVVIDTYIPFVAEALGGVADVVALAPEDITPDAVRDADALIIRTRTRADRALLDGSRVRFIATATIGYDHIDTAYCDQAGITWLACPGCNAQAVCDYIEEAIFQSSNLQIFKSLPTLGIVGYGHIGQLVAKMASRKGFRVLLNDPPKGIGVSLDEIARECDIITFHTPLTYAPTPFPTFHLCDAAFLGKCKPDALIINAARGGVVDEAALLASGHKCIIDCWENEPQINTNLLLSSNTVLASFHIAGYSLQGKINASQTCLDAFCKHFGLPACAIQKNVVPLQPEWCGDTSEGWLQRVSDTFKARPEDFEQLRKQYKLR